MRQTSRRATLPPLVAAVVAAVTLLAAGVAAALDQASPGRPTAQAAAEARQPAAPASGDRASAGAEAAARVRALAGDDGDARIAAIQAIAAQADASARDVLAALVDGELRRADDRVLIVRGGTAVDAITGERLAAIPDGAEEVIANNRVRREAGLALAALALHAPDVAVRRSAARTLQGSEETRLVPVIRAAAAAETDEGVRSLLALAAASIQLRSPERSERLDAVASLAASGDPQTKTLLLALLEKKDGKPVEPDAEVRVEAERALKAVERRLAKGEWVGHVFSGISLGSVLLLVALGLAITYGLMGVINMAHGEMMMLGAYATYATQVAFRRWLPDAFELYLVAAIPVAFAVAAAAGAVLERTVIRFLYGRPLETLLATWGISLVLIQLARTTFGAQNVQVENPGWMSGGIEAMAGVVLPYNRIAIIVFSALILLAAWLLLTRTRLGLFVRAVTQNRAMAGCLGVATPRVDTHAFALGSGIAGLAGCALSQIGNVGPDLGQSYIVDSFMVVVLGGVGQLAGTVLAALGLGVANKFLEAWSGAVLAKIAVLVFVVVFIQRRPQGLFALKGRTAEA